MTHDYQASHEFPEWAHELNLLGVWVINGLVGRKQTLITGLGDLPGRIKSCRGSDALLPSRAPLQTSPAPLEKGNKVHHRVV